MNAATTTTAAGETETGPGFDALDAAFRQDGAASALETLAGTLAERGQFRPLLDALLLKARH